MTGSALMDFLVTVISLVIAVTIIYVGIDMIAPDERFKKIARYAIGGMAIILFLLAVKGVLFGGGSTLALITPLGMVYFTISVIVIVVALFVINWCIENMTPNEWTNLREPVRYVLGALALIAILYAAAHFLLSGGSVSFFGDHGRPLLEQKR